MWAGSRFILANGKRHPAQMGRVEVEVFLTNLAARGQMSAGMQNQALAAPLFLYCEVLGVEMPMPSPAGSIHSPPRVALWIRGVAALAVIPSRKKCCSVR
ncbi:hypothetical protein FHR61_004049 [Xanthomonas arboricola]|uniref:Integrase SAM-like N-terminal domain-containing protein n=1 Tax=Xanthomonas cannabis TaxID=1885674 RepID=A0ABR6JRG6_9XANT|nr:hypothetical protein [Xanthomonas cannabis]MBB5524158.1 hypothetical protein [Xanthomonas cannabis]